MKWTCWIAALVLCCGTVTAEAGLFGGHHGPGCAAPADCCPPSCAAPAACAPACGPAAECCPAPTCCAPAAPVHCAPACGPADCCPPSCCAPAQPCCPAQPSCCAPAACAPTCHDHGHYCAPKKRGGCLSGLFDKFRNRGGHGHGNDCCPPSCAAPVHCH